jgi:hypothetical protein
VLPNHCAGVPKAAPKLLVGTTVPDKLMFDVILALVAVMLPNVNEAPAWVKTKLPPTVISPEVVTDVAEIAPLYSDPADSAPVIVPVPAVMLDKDPALRYDFIDDAVICAVTPEVSTGISVESKTVPCNGKPVIVIVILNLGLFYIYFNSNP